MTGMLSDWAKEFLREEHFAVLSTLNKDGSSQLTTMWYMFENDGTIVLSTPSHLRKVKNLRRDPRIAICVQDGNRYVSLYGTVAISEDQTIVRQDIQRLVERYIQSDEATRQQTIEALVQQSRISLRLTPKKVTEFSV
ncbi:MAG: PPOX class F420-dependent oxidoreductase [Ktedonobacteraceae bacterium]